VLSALPVAILAGGLASRMQPLTRSVPKALLQVAGRPFVLHQLELLRQQGIARVILCVGHLGAQIEARLGSEPLPGLHVEYSRDGSAPLGTGGALRQALPLLGPEFFVMYGDSYLQCSLAQVQCAFRAAGRPALMTVLRNEGRWGVSNARVEAGVLLEYDKRAPGVAMHHIDFGLSVCSASALADAPGGVPLDLGDVWQALARRGALAAYEVTGRFYEIGSPEGFRDTEAFLASRSVPA
jgi:NDP-sugar pyrophosphorylase family protein